MLTTVRQAFHLMGREHRARWVLLLFLAIVTSLLEIVAAALVYFLLSLVADPTGAIDLPLIGDIRSMAAGVDQRTLLLSLAGIMMGFFLIRAIITLAAEYVTQRVIHNAAAALSVKLVKGYLEMPYSFHLQHSSPTLIRNGHSAALQVVSTVFYPVIRVMAELVLTVGILALLAVISPIGTGIAIAVVGCSTLILMLVVQPRLKRMGATAWAMQQETLAALQQSFQGVRDIKTLELERFFSGTYGRARWRLARMLYMQATLGELPRLVIDTSLMWFILAFFAATIAMGSAAQGALSILGLFAYAGLRLQPSMYRIAAGFNSLKFSTAPTADMHRDLQMIEENAAKARPAEPLPFKHEIRLLNVSFGYQGSQSEAVTGIDLTIRHGEQIGICGATGGGKTTLADLITGLLTPSTGCVTVDGRDIAANVRGWQRNLGVVPQMIFIIDDSLRRNVALGHADSDIDEEALREAVRLAQLDDFVESLPEGLETVVGERGVRISGGERQRIAIARALYRRPQVLIFDEGTSALDNATEQELMRSLQSLRGDYTIILVAHRLSTVRNADRVVFLEGGRIAGMDTFEGLRQSNESFRQMAGMS